MSDQNRERFESMLARLAFDFRSKAESETLHKAILHAYDVLQTRFTESNQEWAKRWKDVMNDRDQERRWKEAAQRESEKLSKYISDLRAEVAIRQETIKQMAVERHALECKLEELVAALCSRQETVKEFQK